MQRSRSAHQVNDLDLGGFCSKALASVLTQGCLSGKAGKLWMRRPPLSGHQDAASCIPRRWHPSGGLTLPALPGLPAWASLPCPPGPAQMETG